MKLSDEQIQGLNDVGLKWFLLKFEERFYDLMYGHCEVSQTGDFILIFNF